MWCCVIKWVVPSILSIQGSQDMMLCHQATSSEHSEHSGLPGCDAVSSDKWFSTWAFRTSRDVILCHKVSGSQHEHSGLPGMWCCVIRWVVLNMSIQDFQGCDAVSSDEWFSTFWRHYITNHSPNDKASHPRRCESLNEYKSFHIQLKVPYFISTNQSHKFQKKIAFEKWDLISFSVLFIGGGINTAYKYVNLTLSLCYEYIWFSMNFTKSRDRTALKQNPSNNSVDSKYVIPLMQVTPSYQRNMQMDSFPIMHLFHTLHAENVQKLTELWFLYHWYILLYSCKIF